MRVGFVVLVTTALLRRPRSAILDGCWKGSNEVLVLV